MTATTAERTGLVLPSPDGRAVLARFFRALGDPSRLALLAFIAGSACTGTECAGCPGPARSRVPARLAFLVPAGSSTPGATHAAPAAPCATSGHWN